MASYETLLIERRDRVAVITINRPQKLNALNIQTRQEGAAALEELREDESVRVVVITGAGEKAFVAGADISEFEGRTAVSQRDVMTARSLFTAVDTFPKPVIAMVNGFCLGGGGTQRLTRLVGEGKAMELILTGDMIDAQHAYNLGLVNAVYPAAELETR